MSAILNSNTKSVCLVGKSWDFHVDVALGITNEENLENIKETTKHFVKNNKEFMFDAEHFFDGYKANPKYALACIKAAYDNGAKWIVLCDTNGGTLPHEVTKIVKEVSEHIPGENLGIHAHNDTGNAVANSLSAVLAGARQIQGTLNGLGERCGNANLSGIIPTLKLKLGLDCISDKQLQLLTQTSRLVSELANLPHDDRQAYVGRSAFAHKGGLHTDAKSNLDLSRMNIDVHFFCIHSQENKGYCMTTFGHGLASGFSQCTTQDFASYWPPIKKKQLPVPIRLINIGLAQPAM